LGEARSRRSPLSEQRVAVPSLGLGPSILRCV
jgi:hypothetical protein